MKKSKKTDAMVATFLGTNTRIEGIIMFQGSIRIDGKLKGKILGNKGSLIIGQDAVVDADVVVDSATIMGEINGVVDAGSRIDVHPPARIKGDIHAPVISIKPGVILNGKCSMKNRTVLNEKAALPKKENPGKDLFTLK
jgi:cytoskeletal protein CcmA (bactofilin family)